MSTTEPTDDELGPSAHGLYDATWGEVEWRQMAEQIVADGVVTWREVTTTILGELNPPQVGTSIASSSATAFGFKSHHAELHPGESFMPYVLRWFYATTGRCIDCGTRLDLQADHVNGRENYSDPRDADLLSNMVLRCRRHNVAKRKSHIAKAGRTLLPAQQALMWILLAIKPVTLLDLARLCRIYGMTMASIRFQEAWAMAIWLEREGHYRMAHSSDHYDLLQWNDGAITRRFASDEAICEGSKLLAAGVPGDQLVCFLASPDDTLAKLRYFEYPFGWLPFIYKLDGRPPTDIAIWPNQKGGTPLAPRGEVLYALALRRQSQTVQLRYEGEPISLAPRAKSFRGTRVPKLPKAAAPHELSLTVT